MTQLEYALAPYHISLGCAVTEVVVVDRRVGLSSLLAFFHVLFNEFIVRGGDELTAEGRTPRLHLREPGTGHNGSDKCGIVSWPRIRPGHAQLSDVKILLK